MHNVVEDGLPFYGGAIEAGTVFFNDEIDLAPYLKAGENTLGIRMVNSLRNTADPFHRADPEPYGVSPQTFSFEKEWLGADCPAFCERYAFVKYGI